MSPIWLDPTVASEIREEAYYRYPEETGGVLLGYRDVDDPELLAVEAQVGPGPKARHRKTSFHPDAHWQEREIAAQYLRSGRIRTYLGDWHSHPDGADRPSSTDRFTARRIAWTLRARARRPLILIAAGDPVQWTLHIYRLRLWRLQPDSLENGAAVTAEIDLAGRG